MDQPAHRPKVLLDIPGIPLPPVTKLRRWLACRWCVVVLLLALLGRASSLWMAKQVLIPFGEAELLRLQVENCDLAIQGSAAEGVAIVQYWEFFGSVDTAISTTQDGKTELAVATRMHMRMRLFRCLVTIAVPNGMPPPFQEVHGFVLGSEINRVVVDAVPANIMSLNLGLCNVEASAIPQKLTIDANRGSIVLDPKTIEDETQVEVQTDHAGLTVTTEGPLEVKFGPQAGAASIVAAPKVTGSLGNKSSTVTLAPAAGGGTPAGKPLRVIFQSLEESPGYFLAGSGSSGAPLQVLQGSAHQAPTFPQASHDDLDHMATWVKQVSSTSAPWIARVWVQGPGLPVGSWQVLSTEAFLALPIEWFILFSVGMLSPVTQDIVVQLLGIPHQWPPALNSTNQEDEADERLWAVFQALRPYLDVTKEATIAWVPLDGTPVLFMKTGANRWRARERDIFREESFMFLCACLLNFSAAVVSSFMIIWFLRQRSIMGHILREENISVASTHRLHSDRAGTSHRFRVMASLVQTPEHGVLLRWRKRTGEELSPYLWIYAQSLTDRTTSTTADEVYIERLPLEQVPTMNDNGVICEFLFPVDLSRKARQYESVGDGLNYQHVYRFRILGYELDCETLLGQSDWSDKVFISPPMSVFDTPFQFIKAFFPVPTSSLDFFMEKYCERNINGKVPQQLVVLSDIKIVYHKNFLDYEEYHKGDHCFLFAYMGQSRGACELQTSTRRCTTYARTAVFDPSRFVEVDDVDDSEALRTQMIPDTLRLGGIDRKDSTVFLNLRLRNSLDAAEGKIEWDDLLEAFDEVDKDEASGERDQTITVDLVVEDQEEFNEDYLCRITARVSFENNIDGAAVEMPAEDRFFQLDAPGEIFYEGMERLVMWDPSSPKLVIDGHAHTEVDIYLAFPDIPDAGRVHIGKKVPTENGVGWTCMVQLPRGWATHSENYIVSTLEVEVPTQGGVRRVGESHRFMTCRTWMLQDAELMYASFCKMNNMSMKNLTSTSLQALGLMTATVELKLIPGLRSSMQFESGVINDQEEVIGCDGKVKIGNALIEAFEESAVMDTTPAPPDSASVLSGAPVKNVSASSLGVRVPATSDSGTGGGTTRTVAAGDAERQIFRPTSKKVEILQHIWPKAFPRNCGNQAYGTDWRPCFLLVNSFYPVDNIMEAAKSTIQHMKFWRRDDQEDVPVVKLAGDEAFSMAETIFLGGLPYFVEAVLFLVQLLTFTAFPSLVLIAALVLEYYMTALQESLAFITRIEREQSFLPDLVFRGSVSGISMEAWFSRLPWSSRAAFIVFSLSIVLILSLIFESNFLRNILPWHLQPPVHKIMDTISDLTIGIQVLLALVFLCTLVLWFLMTVVLYPEQMITVIACVAGIVVVLYTMIANYQLTRQNISRYLREEVPEIFDLVCDNFLEEYDKRTAGSHKTKTRQRNQAEQTSRRYIEHFLLKRFEKHEFWEHFKILWERPSIQLSVGHRVWDRALLKRAQWDLLLYREDVKAGMEATDRPGEKAKSTTKILADLGLAQEETAELTHFDLRVRLLDRENEAGGECVHQYSKELRQKLMHIFVRLLEEQPLPPDIVDLVNDPDRFGKAMFDAHESKLGVMQPLSVTSSGVQEEERSKDMEVPEKTTLLELLIQDVNQQKLKHRIIYETLVAHLDEALHPEELGDSITAFVERRLADEVETQLRLTLDEQTVGRAMQKLFERLHIWKGRFVEADKATEERLTKSLTLEGVKNGLMATLETLGILPKEISHTFRMIMFRSMERRVRAWRKDEAEGGKSLVIDTGDLEDFIRELLENFIWWGAMEELLQKIGFPMGDGVDQVPRREVMMEFERMCSLNGFMPKEHVLEFLRAITKADEGDGPAGRIWKSRMVMLMQDAGVCGFVHVVASGSPDSPSSPTRPPTRIRSGLTTTAALSEFAPSWPEWMEQTWRQIAPAWQRDATGSARGGDVVRNQSEELAGRPKPFMPKSKIQQFLKQVIFSESLHVQGKVASDGGDETDSAKTKIQELEIISKEYDNWYKHKHSEHAEVWTKRGKSLLKLRGIWAECFYTVLEQLENKVDEKTASGEHQLFDAAMEEWRAEAKAKGMLHLVNDGLLDIGFFKTWLKRTLVSNRDCSLPVFKEVLKRAQITLPPLITEALWYAGQAGDLHPSLRNARDLEDRLVMYLSKGLCYESVRSLVFDELQTTSLQSITESELRVIFTQMDQKTGRCGFAEPHEVHELICMITQQGMSSLQLIQAFKRLKLTFSDKRLKAAFMLMDTNADDEVDLPEFLGLVDYLIMTLIPEEVFSYLNLEPWQIAAKLLLASATLCIIFMFIFISLNAFQVRLGTGDTGAGASFIRAGLALGAALGLRREAGADEDRDTLFTNARERLYYLTGVTQSQVEARRRYGLTQQTIMPQAKMPKMGKLPKRRRQDKREDRDEEDDENDDDGEDDGF